jgi:hypothetical protein
MQDNTDHNKLAYQMAARLREEFVATRLNELASFEKQASGEKPRKSKRAAAPAPAIVTPAPIITASPLSRPPTAAQVATPGATTMSLFGLPQDGHHGKAGLRQDQDRRQGRDRPRPAPQEAGHPYADKPVAFFDTETGSDYLIPDFEAAGIPLVRRQSRRRSRTCSKSWMRRSATARR